jgi:hypothetical protein
MKTYIEDRLKELTKETDQVYKDCVKDYIRLLEQGCYVTQGTVKAIKDYNKGDVIGEIWEGDYIRKALSAGEKGNVVFEGNILKAIKNIKEDDCIIENK